MEIEKEPGVQTVAQYKASLMQSAARSRGFYALHVERVWMKTSRSAGSEEVSIWVEGCKYKHESANDFRLRLLFKVGYDRETPKLIEDQTGAGPDTIETTLSPEFIPAHLEQLRAPDCFIVINHIKQANARSDIITFQYKPS